MSAPELVTGSVVAGKYTIRSRLLQGGATATYRAVAAKNREVALKIYDPAILSFPDVLQTLAQHQSIGAKLPPHQIVPIVDSGTEPNSGAPFTVTDFQSGSSLAQLIDRGPLSLTDMLALVRALAAATDLLHSSGIVNLTLHPGNVFVRPGTPFEVRVADFGSSLIRRTLPAPEKAGRWMPWLAPEQLKAQSPPTRAADIFAFGLIAFFAATGKPYWRSSQVKVPDLGALRREILGERMPASVRASEFSITLNPAVDAIFARALAFRPTERYSTGREFAAALEAVLSAASVAEAAPVQQRMAPPPPRKMPQRATMVGMGVREDPTGPSATAGPRPPMSTMLGMGDPAAEAPAPPPAKPAATGTATAPAKISAPGVGAAPARGAPPAKTLSPALATAPAKPPAPATTTAPAKVVAPATAAPVMPVALATSAEPPMAVARATAQRAAPPPLPLAPPPAELEDVLVRFETDPPDRLPIAAMAAPSTAGADVMQAPPAWHTPSHGDPSVESAQTGVAVVGANGPETPKNSQLRWIASICGLLVLTGGAAWALSGGTSGSRGRAAPDAKVTATAQTTAPPVAAEAPSAMAQPQPANAVEQGAEEPPSGASLEPAAPPPPAPTVPEPEATEPPAPAAHRNTPAQPATAQGSPSANSAPWTAPAAARPQPSQKPCGKFLKRCK